MLGDIRVGADHCKVIITFILWQPPTGTSVDLDNGKGTGGNLSVDTNTHVMAARINYAD